MGKGKRERGRKTVQQLTRATHYVGRNFGSDPHCVQAVALLVRVGQLLGHQLTPRAVSIAAVRVDEAGVIRAAAAIGPRGAATCGQDPSLLAANPEGWDGAGHLIATLGEPTYVFDPTIQQLSRHLGVPSLALAGPSSGFTPKNREFNLFRDALRVRYHLVPSDETWVAGYQQYFDKAKFPGFELLAGDIAEISRTPLPPGTGVALIS